MHRTSPYITRVRFIPGAASLHYPHYGTVRFGAKAPLERLPQWGTKQPGQRAASVSQDGHGACLD
jgi:hypothetical protein